MAPPILIQVTPRRAERDEIELVEDLDDLVEVSMCSCNAGDDNPY